jgi:hypothetical protein
MGKSHRPSGRVHLDEIIIFSNSVADQNQRRRPNSDCDGTSWLLLEPEGVRALSAEGRRHVTRDTENQRTIHGRKKNCCNGTRRCQRDMRRFTAFGSVCRWVVPNIADMANLLNRVLKKARARPSGRHSRGTCRFFGTQGEVDKPSLFCSAENGKSFLV